MTQIRMRAPRAAVRPSRSSAMPDSSITPIRTRNQSGYPQCRNALAQPLSSENFDQPCGTNIRTSRMTGIHNPTIFATCFTVSFCIERLRRVKEPLH